MLNPGQQWLCWGISAKKKFIQDPWRHKSFYGVGTRNYWNLHGQTAYTLIGKNREKIREKINMRQFVMTNGDVDMYLDADQGIFKFCVVGIADEDKEVYIDGLCNSENKDGWVPCLLFANGTGSYKQQLRACCIDSECYGKEMDIQWE